MNVLVKLNQAEHLLAETKDLEELKDIHDIARAAEAYAQAHSLGIELENHAIEIRLLAARRIGELKPAEDLSQAGAKGGRGKKPSESRNPFPISPQRLSEFRKLAEIPMAEFKDRIEVVKEKREKITYNKILMGDWYQRSDSPEWETPQWLFDILNEEFCFDLDVCATPQNAKCKNFYTKEDDGLLKEWQGTCWMNPPYGLEIPKWMQKAFKASQKDAKIICLVPARIDTDWWWENCIKGEIRFIKGRLHFSNAGASPFPSAVVILGGNIEQKVIWWDVQSN